MPWPFSHAFRVTTASVLAALVNDLSEGYTEVLGSNTGPYDVNGMKTLMSNHAMSIYGYDSATGEFEIRNPWGTEDGQG